MKIPTLVRSTRVGRVVVPEGVPDGACLFYTTADFNGYLDGSAVEDLRSVIHDLGGIDASLMTCHQVHGTGVANVDRPEETWRESSACDALSTRSNNVALGIKVADCLPVTFIDRRSNWIANAHAGWRGAAAGIVARTFDAFGIDSSGKGSGRESVLAYLGPSIRECCFEVGEEVVDAFSQTHGDISEFVDRSRSKPHVAIASIVTRSLLSLGLSPGNIRDTGLCTRCDGSLFHSYRRSGKNAGRNLAIVAH